MFEKYLRKYYQMLFVDPVAKELRHWDFLFPSHLTVLGCLMGIFGAYQVACGWTLTGLCLIFLSGYLDTLDGTLARFSNRTSDFGSALDIVADRIVECAIVLGLYAIHAESALLSLLMLCSILICVTSFLVVGIFSKNKANKGFYYSPGLIERGEAFVFFALMIVFSEIFDALAVLFTTSVCLTALIRLYQFYSVSSSSTDSSSAKTMPAE